MDTENGVLELWSNGGTRNGVKEYRSSGVAGPLFGAGPEASAPRKDREAGAGWKRWVGRRINPGKGGLEVRKRTGFSSHFPDDPMQVVDFPRLRMVRTFLDANLASQARHEMGAQWSSSLTRNVVANEREFRRILAEE